MDEVDCIVSYISHMPVKYTYTVFHLDARDKMIPYFPEDNIPWTEEIVTKLLLQISPVWFHSKALKIFSTFLIYRGWWSYLQLFRKNSQHLINQVDLLQCFYYNFPPSSRFSKDDSNNIFTEQVIHSIVRAVYFLFSYFTGKHYSFQVLHWIEMKNKWFKN